MRLAVIGCRDFTDKSRLFFELDQIKKVYKGKIHIVSGCIMSERNLKAHKGADQFACQWAHENKVEYTGFEAEWKDFSPPCIRKTNQFGEYNAMAGPKRNSKIIANCDQVLAFWDGVSDGTADALDKADAAGKKSRIIKFKR